MWLGSITFDQVQRLEQIFAKFNGEDWICPDWLIYLRQQVVQRDYYLIRS
jgi:hypothetical protein